MRYTKSEVLGMFNRLCKALGKHNGPIYNNNNRDELEYEEGGWVLDYNPTYGGYVIEELGESGSVRHPLGSMRRSTREMYMSMYMASCAAEIKDITDYTNVHATFLRGLTKQGNVR